MTKIELAALKRVFSVGSGDWDWQTEYDLLARKRHTLRLMDSIRADGIREPILLGSDGRVWDGHHRIVAATKLGFSHVPVVFSGEEKSGEQNMRVCQEPGCQLLEGHHVPCSNDTSSSGQRSGRVVMIPRAVMAMRDQLGEELIEIYGERVEDPVELADWLIKSGWVVAPPKNEGENDDQDG